MCSILSLSCLCLVYIVINFRYKYRTLKLSWVLTCFINQQNHSNAKRSGSWDRVEHVQFFRHINCQWLQFPICSNCRIFLSIFSYSSTPPLRIERRPSSHFSIVSFIKDFQEWYTGRNIIIVNVARGILNSSFADVGYHSILNDMFVFGNGLCIGNRSVRQVFVIFVVIIMEEK
jgi:hypothetical protein